MSEPIVKKKKKSIYKTKQNPPPIVDLGKSKKEKEDPKPESAQTKSKSKSKSKGTKIVKAETIRTDNKIIPIK